MQMRLYELNQTAQMARQIGRDVGHRLRQWRDKAIVSSLLVSNWVYAQTASTGTNSGISGMFTNLGKAVKNFISMATIVAVAIGVAAVLYGLVMMIKKGMGRGDDIEWRQIIWPLVGGALASVVMYVLYALVGEVGAPESDMGKTWGTTTTTTP